MALVCISNVAGTVSIAGRRSFLSRGARVTVGPRPAEQSFRSPGHEGACMVFSLGSSPLHSHAFRLNYGGHRCIGDVRKGYQHAAGFRYGVSASLAMNKEATDTSHPSDSVRTKMKYYREIPDRPYLYVFPPPKGKPATNLRYEQPEIEITDLRPVKASMNIDRNGFELVSLKTALTDFTNDDEIARVYYPEAAAAIKSVTGGSRVHIFDHTIRRRKKDAGRQLTKGEDLSASQRQPVDQVHVDYTEKSGPQRVRDLMGDEADSLLKRRFAIVQLWRPLKGPVLDAPLGLVDASTVSPEDLQTVDLIYENRVGEVIYVKHSPLHKWYYLSQMMPDEAFAFKCYESNRSGVARFTPHSAFIDPSTPPEAPRRESIEIRSLVFWDE